MDEKKRCLNCNRVIPAHWHWIPEYCCERCENEAVKEEVSDATKT